VVYCILGLFVRPCTVEQLPSDKIAEVLSPILACDLSALELKDFCDGQGDIKRLKQLPAAITFFVVYVLRQQIQGRLQEYRS
jgi:hypothetical protein